jgi:hypothetical protein
MNMHKTLWQGLLLLGILALPARAAAEFRSIELAVRGMD